MSELPSYQTQEEFLNRQQKLREIRQLNIEPYPHCYKPSHTLVDILSEYHDKTIGDSEQAEKGEGPQCKLAGRLILFRAMGKNAFAHIQEGGVRLQVMFNRDMTKVEGLNSAGELSAIKFIEKKLDLGDFIGVEGHLFRTHKGELTLYAKHVTLLSKSLLPLPEKHSGVSDKEIRYRKRWLDLIANVEVRRTFEIRSRLIQAIREELCRQNFLEVETPVLQNTYGGAAARPFKTHLHALDLEMYMRISPEISLKKLVVGGMERIFEISKVFRNEGIDKTHNPEFTILEAYAAYMDYNDMMVLVEELIEGLVLKFHGKTALTYTRDSEEMTIDFKAPWKRMTMKESIKVYAGIDVDTLSDAEIKKMLENELKNASRGLLIAALFDEKVTEKLIQPHHITDHPIETTPLCKTHRDQVKGKGLVERFETFIAGKELCNSYTELNDPEFQRALLEEQVKQRDRGDEEAHPLDEEFIEAICQGMPPTGGVGIGIDRLTMLLTNAESIRDVVYFPVMKPRV